MMTRQKKQRMEAQGRQGGWVMRRTLALCGAVLLMGTAGFGFGLTGSWSTEIDILPAPGLEETILTLTYSVAGWDITSKSVFTGDAGYEEQLFQLSGQLAFADVSGLMVFDPMGPAYKRAFLRTDIDLLGYGFGLGWYHGTDWDEEDPGIGEELWLGWEHPDVAGRLGTPFALKHLDYLGATETAVVLDVGVDPYYGQVVLTDANRYGLGFHKFTGLVKDRPLCCGITFDAQLTFTKAGFQDLKFGLVELFTLMDLFTLDVLITYGVDRKSVSTQWEFVGFPAVACVELYTDMTGLFAVDLQAFGITCAFSDCYRAFFGTAFVAERLVFEEGEAYAFPFAGGNTWWWEAPEDFYGPTVVIPEEWEDAWELESGWKLVWIEDEPALKDPPAPPGNGRAPWEAWELWWWHEFEVVELSMCGPGCCGAAYEVGLTLTFVEFYELDMKALWVDEELKLTKVGDTLFGLSRVGGWFSVPVMENLSLETTMGYSLITEAMELTLGWTFTF